MLKMDLVKVLGLWSCVVAAGVLLLLLDAGIPTGMAVTAAAGFLPVFFGVSVLVCLRKRKRDGERVGERVVYWDQGGSSYARSDGADDWMTRDSSQD